MENEKGIFINGKQQVIEMLQYMGEKEKKKLLNNIKLRNPSIAKELSEKSFSFKSLFSMNNESLRSIFNNSNPTLVGLALYNESRENQKIALSVMDRHLAEKAFYIMNQNLTSKANECSRAQKKILQYAISLSKTNKILL
ncbi:MAG: hypothetical protein N4A33_10095 [Bacteriovoracaceae bacterium]|jgi:flagellar motor switch protein FliG|nr:hypothetical protein [Bacteriovoracaceae bacterium]